MGYVLTLVCVGIKWHIAKPISPRGKQLTPHTSDPTPKTLIRNKDQKKNHELIVWRDCLYIHLCNVRYAPHYLMNAKMTKNGRQKG